MKGAARFTSRSGEALAFGAAGPVAAAVAAALSAPFSSIAFGFQRGVLGALRLYTFGSAYALIFDASFGAILCAALALLLCRGRWSRAAVVAKALRGGLFGASACVITDAALDVASASFGRGYGTGASLIMAWPILWAAALAVFLPALVNAAVGLSPVRIRAALWASVLAVGTVLTLQLLLAPAGLAWYLAASRHPGATPAPNDLGRFALNAWTIESAVVGAAVGVALFRTRGLFSKAKLTLVSEVGGGRCWQIESALTTIGGTPSAEVRLPSSPERAESLAIIAARDGHFLLQRSGAQTLLVNGQNVDSAILQDKDTIEFGGHLIRFNTVAPLWLGIRSRRDRWGLR